MRVINMKDHLKWSGLVWVGMILVTACTAPPSTGKAVQSEQAAITAAVAADPTTTSEADAGSSQPAATEAGQGGQIPTPRAGLTATDPETVLLASGEIQLVEFFAFW